MQQEEEEGSWWEEERRLKEAQQCQTLGLISRVKDFLSFLINL